MKLPPQFDRSREQVAGAGEECVIHGVRQYSAPPRTGNEGAVGDGECSMHHTMSMNSDRTTISLPSGLNRRIRALAMAEHRSVSSIMREALEAYLEGMEPPGMPSFAGVGASGVGDVAERAEELLREGFGSSQA